MRIISGNARGRKLKALDGLDIRPTTDRVKESVFNIIQFDLPGCKFLDLFAGTGQIGLEALSRGARSAIFVDKSKKSAHVLKENIAHCGFGTESQVVAMDSFAFIKDTNEKFDIIYLDPPFEQNIIPQILDEAAQKLNKNGLIVCECTVMEVLPSETANLCLKKEYKYGKIKISIYHIPSNDEEE